MSINYIRKSDRKLKSKVQTKGICVVMPTIEVDDFKRLSRIFDVNKNATIRKMINDFTEELKKELKKEKYKCGI